MGQDQSSSLVDESIRPSRLKHRSLESIARYIRDGNAQKVVVMVGAGISTSAGIPDFRSPDTGLYANLARLNLPYAEAVFTISYFKENPIPFYTLAPELYPGQYRPTISHAFIRLLEKKGLLLKVFTQNIDCLEREAGISEDLIVEAHGSFATHSCIECKSRFPEESMKKAIDTQEVPHCQVPQCNGLVKPDIVFFGEGLPERFFQTRALPESADLCLVMGTSLTVHPFASLPGFCREETPRLLINMERVGDLGSRPDDVLFLGDCDAGIRKLAAELAWEDELDELWATIKPELAKPQLEKDSEDPHQTLEDKIASLTGEVDRSLKISDGHVDDLKSYLAAKTDVDSAMKKAHGPSARNTEDSPNAGTASSASNGTMDAEKHASKSEGPPVSHPEGRGESKEEQYTSHYDHRGPLQSSDI